MKLFWKIFFSTMIVSIICLVIGGIVLIKSSFLSQIHREINNTFSQNDGIAYTLVNEMGYIGYDLNRDAFYKKVEITAKNMDIYQSNTKLQFMLLDSNKKVIHNLFDSGIFSDILYKNINLEKRGYIIINDQSKYKIQAITPVLVEDKFIYIATQKDVTSIFANQQQQLRMLISIILVMIFIAGIVTGMIVKILIKRIGSLTVATSSIARGELSQRVEIFGNDEITILSMNFNHMADELQGKIMELKNVAQNRELFVAAFSHELKTPLTSIIGYSDMLRGKNATPERTQMCADYIYNEGRRLELLSMQLLDLIVIKHQDIKLQNIYMPLLFEELRKTFDLQMIGANIKIDWNIKSGNVFMEPNLMKCVFINLLDNARKAIDNNGSILVKGILENGVYSIKIIDDGRGMDIKDIEKIKEAFYMADKSRSRNQGGVGLGLTICDEILNLHGFTITFESELGKGTTVTIRMKGVSDNAKEITEH